MCESFLQRASRHLSIYLSIAHTATRITCTTRVTPVSTIYTTYYDFDDTHRVFCNACCIFYVCITTRTMHVGGSCLNRARTAQTFCFDSLVYGDVNSMYFWWSLCGLLVCLCEGSSTLGKRPKPLELCAHGAATPPYSFYPPPPPCISYALVEATVGVGTVLIWYRILIQYQT